MVYSILMSRRFTSLWNVRCGIVRNGNPLRYKPFALEDVATLLKSYKDRLTSQNQFVDDKKAFVCARWQEDIRRVLVIPFPCIANKNGRVTRTRLRVIVLCRS